MEEYSTEAFSALKKRLEFLELENEALRKKQVAIEKAKELYLRIFEDFPALIWRAGLDKLCNHFNRTWLEFTGRTMEQEAGNGWAEGVHPDDFQFCLDTYVAKFDLHEPFLMEYRLLNKDKEYRWIRDYGRPFYDLDGTFSGYIGSCYDVTSEKGNEEKLSELNEAKNKFLSILAHDLINPFNNIMGASQILVSQYDEMKPERVRRIAENIYGSAGQTLELLRNLLEWGSIQLKNKSFSPKELLLSHLVRICIDQLSSLANHKSIGLKVEMDAEIQIFGDEYMLLAIIRNLITNAIKFSFENGTVVLSAKTDGKKTTVTVRDFGVGMTDQQLSKLFKLAEKTSTYGTNNEKGIGLGLVLCKDFIDIHKGEIWAESEEGEGSRFIFTIPANG